MKRRLTNLFNEFFNNEKTAGLLLIVCTAVSLLIANSVWGYSYIHFWHTDIGFSFGPIKMKYPIEYWVNDGLMAIFFLLIGLEIEREIYIGELADIKTAMLPIFGALGGMIVPALFHFSLNHGTETQAGIGIPMATDIAFALGILYLLGNRVPVSLKIFLTALAIIDDLGAIIVIALFYSNDFSIINFSISMGIFGGLLLMNRMKVEKAWLYLIPGIAMWYFMLHSGVHATISGVLLAFAIPFGNGRSSSLSYKLQHFLHKPVALLVVPIFALANTGIQFTSDSLGHLVSLNSLGVILGLVVGKPVGILLFTYIAIAVGLCTLPEDIRWRHLVGVGILAGIGFTMSIFIAILAFANPEYVVESKIAIFTSSLVAGVTGFLFLKYTKPGPNASDNGK